MSELNTPKPRAGSGFSRLRRLRRPRMAGPLTVAPVTAAARHQGGYTMLLMLVFVALFGSALAALVYNKNNSQLRTQAAATGEHVAQIARAARIYVRDRSLDPGDAATLAPGDPFFRERIAPAALLIPMPEGGTNTGPFRTITVADLIGTGLLPNGFGQLDGGDYVTPMGQEIRIIAGNAPLMDDPRANPNVVATAYIYIVSTPSAPPAYISDIVVSLREQGVSVSAPIFDAAGNNITGTDCRGTPAVALWDTGCLNLAEFQQLTGDIAFVPGSLVIPAWRAVQFDLRAIMRYPQPENPGYATMLTNLRMGREIDTNGDGICDDVDQIGINDDTGTVSAGICRVEDDDALAATVADQDRRFDIRNVSELETDGIIVTPQATDVRSQIENGTGNILADATPELRISADLSEGLIVAGPATVRNDVRVYDTMALPAGTETRMNLQNMLIRRNLVASNPDVGDADQPAITTGELVTDDLNADMLRQTAPGGMFDPAFMRLSELSVDGSLTVRGGGTATMENVRVLSDGVSPANVNAKTGIMTGVTQVTDLSTTITDPLITPAGPMGAYRAVIAEYDGAGSGTTNITGNLRVSEDVNTRSAVFGGSTDTQRLDIHNGGETARCFGDCPDRVPDPGPPF